MSTPQAPSPQDYPTAYELGKWLPADPITEELTEAEKAMQLMMSAGYSRNVYRHAEAWGPVLIAAMVKAKVLGPEEDPLELLESMIYYYNEAMIECDAIVKFGDTKNKPHLPVTMDE